MFDKLVTKVDGKKEEADKRIPTTGELVKKDDYTKNYRNRKENTWQ